MNLFRELIRRSWFSKISVTCYDSLMGGLSMYGAIQWRYDFWNKPVTNNIDDRSTLIFVCVCIMVWVSLRVYKAIWRFTSLEDVKDLFIAVLLSVLITFLVLFLFFDRAIDFPRATPLIVIPLFFGLCVLSRVIYMFFYTGDLKAALRPEDRNKPRALLVGSENGIHDYLRDRRRRSGGTDYNILGLIDSGTNHKGRSIFGIPVLGPLEHLREIYGNIASDSDTPPTLIVTDAQTDRFRNYDLVRTASTMGAPLVRVNPGASGTLTPFETADLIGRPLRALDISPVAAFLKGKSVLITGAGGTIGSELTRQVMALSPCHVSLVEHSEFHLYEIDHELQDTFPEAAQHIWTAFIGDIRDKIRMREIFTQVQPDIILHAAALKHVPLGESNPFEILKTNVYGTQVLLDLSHEFGVQSFTLISSDKAVKPSNIMGASKRLTEMQVMCAGRTEAGGLKAKYAEHPMSICAVRFGNVLASNGSVVPLFESQIARGGPVTVTHKDVNRYFMTTQEATALVLQSAAMNAQAQPTKPAIYVLEMGEPVNIAFLARQLIRLRGHVPDRDIKIKFTGLRPGEKLTEILRGDKEDLSPSGIDGVQIYTGGDLKPKHVRTHINKIIKAVPTRDGHAVIKSLHALIPCYVVNDNLQVDAPSDS